MQPSLNLAKKLRIIYTDPDATDSSSDEEEMNKPKSRKQIINEISCSSPQFEPSRDNDVAGSKRLRKSSTKGVRTKPWGKFSSEIRDPFKKKRPWLGTHCTEAEAAAVYQKKKREFEILMAAEQRSPSSVLDVSVNPIEEKAKNEEKFTIKEFKGMKKVVRETVKEEVSIENLRKDEPLIMEFWELPDSSEELLGLSGFGNQTPCSDHWLSENPISYQPPLRENAKDKFIDLPDIKTETKDLAWVDEILNLGREVNFADRKQ